MSHSPDASSQPGKGVTPRRPQLSVSCHTPNTSELQLGRVSHSTAGSPGGVTEARPPVPDSFAPPVPPDIDAPAPPVACGWSGGRSSEHDASNNVGRRVANLCKMLIGRFGTPQPIRQMTAYRQYGLWTSTINSLGTPIETNPSVNPSAKSKRGS